MNNTNESKFYLLILKNGKYAIEINGHTVEYIKQYRKTFCKGAKYRIIESNDEFIQSEADKLNKLIQPKRTKLIKDSYRAIAETMANDRTYRHSEIFNSREEAYIHIRNFGSFTSRNNEYKNLFKTNTTHCIIDDELFFITIFSSIDLTNKD